MTSQTPLLRCSVVPCISSTVLLLWAALAVEETDVVQHGAVSLLVPVCGYDWSLLYMCWPWLNHSQAVANCIV